MCFIRWLYLFLQSIWSGGQMQLCFPQHVWLSQLVFPVIRVFVLAGAVKSLYLYISVKGAVKSLYLYISLISAKHARSLAVFFECSLHCQCAAFIVPDKSTWGVGEVFFIGSFFWRCDVRNTLWNIASSALAVRATFKIAAGVFVENLETRSKPLAFVLQLQNDRVSH